MRVELPYLQLADNLDIGVLADDQVAAERVEVARGS
jgi:hypothetical protein